MTETDINLSSRIVRELFGDACSIVSRTLLKEGELNIPLLRKSTKLPVVLLKRALVVLCHHRVVSAISSGQKDLLYSCSFQAILTTCFYKHYIALVKRLYGDICEILVEELLFVGQLRYEDCIRRTAKRLNEVLNEPVTEERVKDKFIVLLREGVIQQVLGVESTAAAIPTAVAASSSSTTANRSKAQGESTAIETVFEQTQKRKRFRCSDFDPNALLESAEPVVKRERAIEPDPSAHYGVAVKALSRWFAEDMLVKLASHSFRDAEAGRVLTALFRAIRKRCQQQNIMPSSGMDFIEDANVSRVFVSLTDVIREVNVKSGGREPKEMEPAGVEAYLTILSDKHNSRIRFVTRVADTYGCDVRAAFAGLTICQINSVVEQRFGLKSLRIFSYVLENDLADQKQVEKTMLMPAKECRERLYELMSGGFITIREATYTPGGGTVVKRPGGIGSASRFGGRAGLTALHTIELDRVSRQLLDWTKKAMFNAISRREVEVVSNRRVIERDERASMLVEAMRQEKKDETEINAVEEGLISPAEKAAAEAVRKSITKLEVAETLLVESLFIFQVAALLFKHHMF